MRCDSALVRAGSWPRERSTVPWFCGAFSRASKQRSFRTYVIGSGLDRNGLYSSFRALPWFVGIVPCNIQ